MTSSSGRGRRRHVGRNREDLLHGESGDDVLYGNVGRDQVRGGAGNDILWGLARGDRGKRGVDVLRGESGDDTINARDGEADVILCGRGADTAILHYSDMIRDRRRGKRNGSCESVDRDSPKRSESRPEDATQSPAEDRFTR